MSLIKPAFRSVFRPVARPILRSGALLDPSASAYIAAVKTDGATVTSAQEDAIQKFFRAGRLIGWYPLLRRMYFPIWGSETPNARCMVSLTAGEFVGGVTHGSGFVQCNGTTGYFNSKVSPSDAGVQLNSASIFALVNRPGSTGPDFVNFGGGVQNEDNATRFELRRSSSATRYEGVGPNSANIIRQTSDQNYRGFYIASRTASNSRYIARRLASGWSVGETDTEASGAVATLPMFFMANNQAGTAERFSNFPTILYGMALGLTPEQAKLFSAAVIDLWETCTGATLT
jgi:hypothetical protein